MDDETDSLFQDVVEADPAVAEQFARMQTRARIATVLSRLRQARGLTQREVADRMGIAQSQVARIERTVGNLQTMEAISGYVKACDFDVGLVFLRRSETGYEVQDAMAVSGGEPVERSLKEMVSALADPGEPMEGMVKAAAREAVAAVGSAVAQASDADVRQQAVEQATSAAREAAQTAREDWRRGRSYDLSES